MRIIHYLIPTNGVEKTVQANPFKPLINDWFAYIRKEVAENRLKKRWFRCQENLPAYMTEDIESFMHWRKFEIKNK